MRQLDRGRDLSGAVGQVAGATAVSVDLTGQTLTVTSEGDLAAEIRDAVEDAGYEVVTAHDPRADRTDT